MTPSAPPMTDGAAENRAPHLVDPEELARRRMVFNDLVTKGIGRRYAGCHVDNFQRYGTAEEQARQTAAVAAVRAYAEELESRVKAGRSVILFGPCGTGKDHLLAYLMRTACRAGHAVEWRNGADLFGNMRDNIASKRNEAQAIARLSAPAILAISDPAPPCGGLTPFQLSVFFRIIDRRYRDGRPTWITANVGSRAEAEARLGVAAVDRLAENALVVFCNWTSYRTKAADVAPARPTSAPGD